MKAPFASRGYAYKMAAASAIVSSNLVPTFRPQLPCDAQGLDRQRGRGIALTHMV